MGVVAAILCGLILPCLVFWLCLKAIIWGLKLFDRGVIMMSKATDPAAGLGSNPEPGRVATDSGLGTNPEPGRGATDLSRSEELRPPQEATPAEDTTPWWEDPATDPKGQSLFALVLRDGPPLDRLLLKEGGSLRVLQSLLGVGLLGVCSFTALVGWLAGIQSQALDLELTQWFGQVPVITYPLVMALAFLLTLAICIPSFYFYTQIAGVDAPFTLITAQALRVQARTGVLLLGSLPFFGVLALGGELGWFGHPAWVMGIGMAAPFLVGFFGLVSLMRSFGRLVDVLPITHPRRGVVFQGFILAWGGLYAVVSPVAVYRLGEALAINVVL